jgi:pSer/pThr/pTyr-binding forkhead associated (FHA) protein
MEKTLRVAVVTGPHKNRKFCFRGAPHLLVGRGLDCSVQLSGTERDRSISRRHCWLMLDAGSLKILDLASTNGTYLNGTRVGCVELPLADGAAGGGLCQCEDKPGPCNLLTIGGTTLRIDLVDCPGHHPPGAEPLAIWAPGETAKHDCPARCLD